MPQKTRLLGIILTIIGIIGYFASGMASITALIPSFFGIIFIVLGRLAEKEKMRKHVMHVALLLALIGFFGTVTGIAEVFSLMGGAQDVSVLAASVRTIMALLCIGYIVLGIQSFIAARRSAS